MLHIVAIAWIYVVLLMSLTEHSVVAGIMTFLMYCVVPLSIILYLIRSPQRKRARLEVEKTQNDSVETEKSEGASDGAGRDCP